MSSCLPWFIHFSTSTAAIHNPTCVQFTKVSQSGCPDTVLVITGPQASGYLHAILQAMKQEMSGNFFLSNFGTSLVGSRQMAFDFN